MNESAPPTASAAGLLVFEKTPAALRRTSRAATLPLHLTSALDSTPARRGVVNNTQWSDGMATCLVTGRCKLGNESGRGKWREGAPHSVRIHARFRQIHVSFSTSAISSSSTSRR